MGHVVGKRAVLPTQVQLLDGKDSAMNQCLSELMDLAGMSKEQLVGLLNAMYELLQQRQAPAPAFTFFIPTNPNMPYISPTVVPMTPVLGDTGIIGTPPLPYTITSQRMQNS